MEHGASELVKEESHMVMTVKADVDKAAQCTAYHGVQTNANITEEEPGFVELVKSEPALVVKEEVVEDAWQGSPTPQDSLMEQPGTYTVLHSLHKECLQTVCRVQLRRLDNFQCEGCDAVYIDAHKLLQHVRDVHGSGANRSLDRHVKSPQISKEGQQCARADNDAQRSNKASQSEQRARSQSYSCDKCGKTYASKESLQAHSRNLHSTESHECTKCNKKFPSKRYLSKHTITVHSEQQYECAVCKKIYGSWPTLYQHVYRVHRPRPAADSEQQYECAVCKKICKSKATLYTHVYYVHRPNPAGIYTCDYCKKMFTDKKEIRRHIAHVHSSGSYKCHQCNKIFKCKKYLMRHKTNLHTAGLQIHTCEVCQKTFRYKSTLRRHTKNIHVAAHVHRCQRCHQNFKSSNLLKRHNTSIHGKPQYKCQVCLKFYKTIYTLRKHFKKAHNSKDIQFQSDSHPHEMPDLHPSADDLTAAASTSKQQHNVDVVKEEPADGELELGPVVFQHMDCNYRPYEEEPQDDLGGLM